MKRRSFNREFKIEAAELVLDKDYSFKEASESLGVSDGAIRSWAKQLEQERGGQTPVGAKALTSEQVEIQQLKKRIKNLETDKIILKKATALMLKDGDSFIN